MLFISEIIKPCVQERKGYAISVCRESQGLTQWRVRHLMFWTALTAVQQQQQHDHTCIPESHHRHWNTGIKRIMLRLKSKSCRQKITEVCVSVRCSPSNFCLQVPKVITSTFVVGKMYLWNSICLFSHAQLKYSNGQTEHTSKSRKGLFCILKVDMWRQTRVHHLSPMTC